MSIFVEETMPESHFDEEVVQEHAVEPAVEEVAEKTVTYKESVSLRIPKKGYFTPPPYIYIGGGDFKQKYKQWLMNVLARGISIHAESHGSRGFPQAAQARQAAGALTAMCYLAAAKRFVKTVTIDCDNRGARFNLKEAIEEVLAEKESEFELLAPALNPPITKKMFQVKT